MTPRVRNVLVLGIVAVACFAVAFFLDGVRRDILQYAPALPVILANAGIHRGSGNGNLDSRLRGNDMKKATVTLGDVSYAVEIADTRALQELGLGNRDALAPGSGMLFVFDKSAEYGFWMKDMRFPIDIVWLGESGEVLGAAENVDYKNQEKTYYPPAPVRYVLELPAGEYAKAGKPPLYSLRPIW